MMKNADKFLEKLKNKKFSGEFDADKFFMYHDIDGVTFENCRLYWLNFSGNTFHDCIFKNCMFTYCFFENCTFKNCTMDNLIIKGGRLEVKFENCQTINVTYSA